MKKILLDSKREKFAYNQDKYVNLGFETTQSLLPISDISDTVNEYEQYYKEYDESKKYRFTFTINPLCSNVLFNTRTEIVYKEGSDECINFSNTTVKYKDIEGKIPSLDIYIGNKGNRSLDSYTLIQDTTFSHAKIGPLVYHCGFDIFNNHILRSKDFIVVNKMPEYSEYNSNFNTLSDYARDSIGDVIKDKILKYKDNGVIEDKVDKHLYNSDSIYTFKQSIDENLTEENGWFGFKNKTLIDIDNITISGENFSVNKCMNNNKAGEFIDMYPDRSLYSFIPKYNKYKNRNEFNWEYCITYPYSSVTNEFVDEIISGKTVYNGIKCTLVEIAEIEPFDDNKIIQFKTSVNHNLDENSVIRIASISGTTVIESCNTIKVASVGKGGYDLNRYFGIRYGDFEDILLPYGNTDTSKGAENAILTETLKNINFRFVKFDRGARCKYYFRKFRKVPNFKYKNIDQSDGVTESEIQDALNGVKQPFNSSLNKMAFSKNIYSDRVAEIIYNDDVNVEGLKDNLGRDLSELFLTIIKTNYGNEEWYISGKTSEDNIEFSHCFGPISTGLDLDEERDYNIHCLHNISDDSYCGRGLDIPAKPKYFEHDISILDNVFYGDLVELSPYTINETELEPIYHRFNTMQRELDSNVFSGLTYDNILFDDNDITSGFTLEQKNYCTGNNNTSTIYSSNLNPEGYYYRPHYRIPIREFSDNIQTGSHQKVSFEYAGNVGDKYYINTATNYYIQVNDTIYLYREPDMKRFTGTVTSVSGSNYTEISFVSTGITTSGLSEYIIFRLNETKPSGAYELDDGTGRYLWKDMMSASGITQDSELYNYPFTNGSHYINETISFYLKRQDPYGYYGLSLRGNMPISLMNLNQDGNYKDVDTYDYIEDSGCKC